MSTAACVGCLPGDPSVTRSASYAYNDWLARQR